jgi:transcriptional regulator with XRE-family HTH domain
MVSQEEILTRNKITGVLLRDARLRAKKSVQECAQVLFCEPEFITRAEDGEEGLTLPQLEILAHVLQVPLSYLLGEGELPAAEDEPELPPYDDIMTVRRKIIGVMLRQARLEANQTLGEIAAILGYTPEHLASVELGEAQITLAELTEWTGALGIPLEDLISEEVAPLDSDGSDKRDLQLPDHLPPEVQEFISRPINVPYLQIAMNLSQMPAQTLRQVAAGLLDITY